MKKINRAEGWKHAKLSGHENEELVKQLFLNKEIFRSAFLKQINKNECSIEHVEIGGLREKNVSSIFGGSTKSKTDLKIILDDKTIFNISIKKSLSGQVYIIPIDRFINGYEKQFNEKIPQNVIRAIQLFWGSAKDTMSIIDKYGTNKSYEKRKNRLVAETLNAYDKSLHLALINWFQTHTGNLFDFCFSRGLASDSCEWANAIWYINELGENSINKIFLLNDLKNYFNNLSQNATYYGNREYGSTIQLPFGFVQWHSPKTTIPGNLQFHHSYKKLSKQ